MEDDIPTPSPLDPVRGACPYCETILRAGDLHAIKIQSKKLDDLIVIEVRCELNRILEIAINPESRT